MNNSFAIIFLCAVLITLVITLFLFLLFNMNLVCSLDNGDYKEYFKESFVMSIYLNFFISTLINTAALFLFNSENIINKTIKMLNFIYLINTIKVND